MTDLYTIRPLSSLDGFTGPAGGDANLFKRGTLTDTHLQLRTELRMLGAGPAVLEVDCTERDIRRDGLLRENARLASNKVRLVFTGKAGTMQFACNKFGWTYASPPIPRADGWQQNLRAITLGLKALRAVDRYGISRTAEQYRGYLQIEGARTGSSGMSVETALQVIAREAGLGDSSAAAFTTNELLGLAVDQARRRSHADRNGGDDSAMRAVNAAVAVLIDAGRIT